MHNIHKVLVIQTAFPNEVAGIYEPEKKCPFKWFFLQGKTLEALCDIEIPEDLDAVAVAVGPGRFTSTRVGVGFALGLGMSRELPLIPLNVFDLIDSEGAEGWYLIMSRKDEYYGSYRANFREVKREIFSDIPKTDVARVLDQDHPLTFADLEQFLQKRGLPDGTSWETLKVEYMKEVAEEYKLWK